MDLRALLCFAAGLVALTTLPVAVLGAPCSGGLQRVTVSNAMDALALAKLANCTGGRFEVTWAAATSVRLRQTIAVGQNTDMNVTGSAGSTVDGGGEIRLFKVASGASLRLEGLALTNGNSTGAHDGRGGGAVFADGGRLVAQRCEFSGAYAESSSGGGAVLIAGDGASGSFSFVTFTANEAAAVGYDGGGGGVAFIDGARLDVLEHSFFVENVATGGLLAYGGGIYFSRCSEETKTATIFNTTFLRNRNACSMAANGGAIGVVEGPGPRIVSCGFEENRAVSTDTIAYGGAIYVYYYARLERIESCDFYRNAALGSDSSLGGAVYIGQTSSVGTVHRCNFSENAASLVPPEAGRLSGGYGASMAVTLDSVIDILSECNFERGTTEGAGLPGGAGGLSLQFSTVRQILGCNFTDCVSGGRGGGIQVHGGGITIIDGCRFVGNNATYFSTTSRLYQGGGGAISLENVHVGSITNTVFERNAAAFGGALELQNSSVGLLSSCSLSGHYARAGGGVVAMYYESSIAAIESCDIVNNGASAGGVLFLNNGTVGPLTDVLLADNWAVPAEVQVADGSPTFKGKTSNYKRSFAGFGGAVYLQLGTTIGNFNNVTCEGNSATESGGCLYLVGDIGDINGSYFFDNTAGASGGAVSNELSVSGLVVSTSDFRNNSARLGGGAILGALNSFAKQTSAGVKIITPTLRLTDCKFRGNSADSFGGAVGSSAIAATGCSFASNRAGDGGAIWADNSFAVSSTNFSHNVAKNGGAVFARSVLKAAFLKGELIFKNNTASAAGGAIFYSGIGNFSRPTGTTFENQSAGCCYNPSSGADLCSDVDAQSSALDQCCTPGTYIDGNGKDCVPCPEGLDCDNVGLVPRDIPLVPGYWRAEYSKAVAHPCLLSDACVGGELDAAAVTDDTAYCHTGYEGPLCAVCASGYGSTLGYKCTLCSAGARAGFIVAILFFGLLLTLLMWYVLSSHRTSMVGASAEAQGPLSTVIQSLPIATLRIPIVVFQIVTQFAAITGVDFPKVYEKFLAVVSVISFDLSWISFGCIVSWSFYESLLAVTLAPLALGLLLACSYSGSIWWLRRRETGDDRRMEQEKATEILHKHAFVVYVASFLIYSTASTVIFQTFSCDDLGGESYLRADYSLKCGTDEHKSYKIYAGFMIIVYPIGIPVLYAWSLWRQREFFNGTAYDSVHSFESSGLLAMGQPRRRALETTGFLWQPYKESHYWWEVMECGRRLLLTGVIVFILPNTAGQVAVACVLAVFSLVVFALFGQPMRHESDNLIYVFGCGIVFLSMFMALIIKSGVDSQDGYSENVLAVLVIVLSVVLIVAAVIQCTMILRQVRVALNEANTNGNMVDRVGIAAAFGRCVRRCRRRHTAVKNGDEEHSLEMAASASTTAGSLVREGFECDDEGDVVKDTEEEKFPTQEEEEAAPVYLVVT